MQKRLFSIISLFLGLSALALTVLIFITNNEPLSEPSINLTQFLGRFHPVILHLPIGILIGLLVLEIVAFKCNKSGLNLATNILVAMLAPSSLLTAGLGLLLAANGDYSGDTLQWHKWLGIVFAFFALILAYLKLLAFYKKGKGTLTYKYCLIFTAVILPIVGHLGGNLTHGSDYLTKYAPEWVLTVLGEDDEEEKILTSAETDYEDVFTQVVMPILQDNCVQCHGPEKQKSRYRLDTYENLMIPGSMGDLPIVPSKVAESKLIEYLWLPEEDEMAMPPEGKPRLLPEEILAITHWVANGAKGPLGSEPYEAPKNVSKNVSEAEKTDAYSKQVEVKLHSEQAKLDELMNLGILALPISRDSELLYVDFQNTKGPVTDESFTILSSLKDQITELKLTNANVTNTQLEAFRGAARLETLDLSNKTSTDRSLELLNSLTSLRKLILFNSDLTDEGLLKLSAPQLEQLYIGSTQVSQNGILDFKELNHHTGVISDVDLSQVQKIKELRNPITPNFKK
ncbi:MAG: c-type cytochrome domain-containing protein [Akkermansiaceae bacterium]